MKKLLSLIKDFCMEKYVRLFCEKKPEGRILYKEDLKQVPASPGAYVIVSNGQKFIYPKGKSPVIYVGQSMNLNRRLRNHFRKIINLSETKLSERNRDWHYTRIQYCAAYGFRIYWFKTKGRQDKKALESTILESFYNKYYALPVGNGAFSFR